MADCHESNPSCGREGHAAAAADPAHAQAHRADLRSALPPLPDRPDSADSGDRRDHPEPELPAAAHRGRLRRWLGAGHQDPLRRRTGAAGHRRRGEVRRRWRHRLDRRVQRRRVDAGGPGGGARAAPRAAGARDHRADAGGQPQRVRLVETDASQNILRFLEKPKPDEITTNYINAGIYVLEPSTFDRIPAERRGRSSAALPVVHRARRDVCRLPVRRLLDRHRDTGK